MTSREFTEWMEYYKLEPFGDDWMQAGVIAASNVNLWSKKKLKPEKFIPRYNKPRKSPQEIEAEMVKWAVAYNQSIRKKGTLSSPSSGTSP